MFESLARAAVGVLTLPIDIVKDVIPQGRCFDDEESSTVKKLKDIQDNIKDATKPKDK